jgi:streptogramin lyase
MADESRLLKKLRSGRAPARYDACEELRVARGVSADAIAALEGTLGDADPLVADAAKRALAIHVPPRSPTAEASAGQAVSGHGRRFRWWFVPLGILLLCLAAWLVQMLVFQIRYGGMPIAAITGGFPPDCMWSATGVAWVDQDANGTWDDGEPPLPGVTFRVNGWGNGYPSDWRGESSLTIWLPGCPDENFEILPDTPVGYEPTYTSQPTVGVRSSGNTFAFGFAQLPAMPTITPRPPSPVCESFRLGSAKRYDVTDVAVASDGSVWVATFNDGLRLLRSGQTEWTPIRAPDGLINDQVRRIVPLPSGEVWFATEGGASSFDGQEWISVSSADGLVNDSVYDIAVAPSGEVWFATYGGVSRFNPLVSSWTSLPSSHIIGAVAISPDGSPWIAPFLGNVVRIDDSSPASLRFAGGPPFESADQLVFAPDGTLWMAGYDGLAHYQPASGDLTIYNLESTVGAFTDGARGLALAGDGSVWVAAEAYVPVLYHFLPWMAADQPSTWRIYDSRDGLPTLPPSVTNSDPVQAVAVASPGDIWIAATEHATHCRFNAE